MTIELIHGDAIATMARMVAEGRRVDLVATDPPYRLTEGGNNPKDKTKCMKGCFSKENYDNKGGIVTCDIDWPDFMPLIYAILADQSHCYVMANNRNVQPMLNAAEAAGFRFHNLLVWDKITCTPNRWYAKNCEFIGMFYKGKAKWIRDMGAKQLIRCPQVDDDSGHPTQKPVALFENYIQQSSKRGDTVFDGFMGVGTTGVAAAKQGRSFVGIEIERKWFEVAEKRIMTATSQSDMFKLPTHDG